MLHIHRAERADGLIEALRALLAEPAADPFAPELIAVPTRGMERWLTQRLSDGLGTTPGRSDGICANVEFPSPRRVIGTAVGVASGIDPDQDGWRPERAVWPLLEVVDACREEPWLRTLAAHLAQAEEADAGEGRRYGTVRQLAERFDRYALLRPDMVRAWADGRHTDGAGRDLPRGAAWQAELWRRLNDRIGQPGPAERLEDACTRLGDNPELVDLPPRISLFGLTRLPAGHLRVLRALSAGRDVHLFLLHPSPALWARVAEATDGGPPVLRRRDDPTATLPDNRLLASWGQDVRELQLVAGGGEGHIDHHHPVAHRGETLLARLQGDVRADRAAPGPPLPGEHDARAALDPGDRSVQVHACHGRARQVEVVRDAILHVLREDPDLEPRDVIVMCPDIETFAPLIQATFGAGEVSEDEDDDLGLPPAEPGPPDLRVRLADRALRQTNPVLGVVAQLIDLAEQRLTASQVLDLAGREPVRRRFRFDDDDLAHVQSWVATSGIRWGLDADHRGRYKLGALAAGTWRAGLDRVLLGVAMSEDDRRLFGGVLPLDDVESGSIELAGRFAEFVDRLQGSLEELSAPKTVDAWVAAIGTAAEALTATPPGEAWQRSELERLLDAVVTEATVAGEVHPTHLALPEIRALLAERLQGRPTRANFRTGHLTVCTLVPMRSVPHRVVCLLGMDDGVFPRKAPRDGDDLTVEDPHVGDRDPRTEDRQMLLDALLAASDRLVVTYTGNDERTNTPRPAAVPVGELLDVIDDTVRIEEGAARERVRVRHPLQPFDSRNFEEPEPWGFDRVMLNGARALSGERTAPAAFLDGPLLPEPRALIEVEDLVRFVQHPVRAFLRQRLGISVGDFSDQLDDALPVELDGLEAWGVGQRLLDARLAGVGLTEALAAEVARGTLPPGELAQPVIAAVRPRVEAIAAEAQAALVADAETGSLDVKVTLAGGRALSGTVPGVAGDVLRVATYSRVNARHRLAAWVRLLALTAARPDRAFEAMTVGRAAYGGPKAAQLTSARIPALGADAPTRRAAALDHLAALVDLYDRGMREPLPLACQSSAAYAAAVAAGKDPEAAGRKAWESAWNFPKEDAELEHQLVLGEVKPFAHLLEGVPHAGEDWGTGETTRFGSYACRLWAELLSVERLEHR